MDKYDILVTSLAIGFLIGGFLGIYFISSNFNEVVIPSKLSELQSQFDLETHRTMPDEIILNNSLECIGNKTIEYFAGFKQYRDIKYPGGSIQIPISNPIPIQNRTYCIKAIEVIRK